MSEKLEGDAITAGIIINNNENFLPDYEEDFSENDEQNNEEIPESYNVITIIDRKTDTRIEEEDSSDEDEFLIESDIDDYLSSTYYFENEEIFQSADSSQKAIDFDIEGQIILQIAQGLGLNLDAATQSFSAWLEPTDSMVTPNMKSYIRMMI